MNEVSLVHNQNDLQQWMAVLRRILSNHDWRQTGPAWWLRPWDLEHLAVKMEGLLFSPPIPDSHALALWTPHAVEFGLMAPHFISPDMTICEELICRSDGQDGQRVRQAFAEQARAMGATHVMIDNADFCADAEHAAWRDQVTQKDGYQPFSRRYVLPL